MHWHEADEPEITQKWISSIFTFNDNALQPVRKFTNYKRQEDTYKPVKISKFFLPINTKLYKSSRTWLDVKWQTTLKKMFCWRTTSNPPSDSCRFLCSSLRDYHVPLVRKTLNFMAKMAHRRVKKADGLCCWKRNRRLMRFNHEQGVGRLCALRTSAIFNPLNLFFY